jgi:uncharacterized membrane-anchored protein
MSPLITRVLAVAGAALALGAVNYSIAGKEDVVRNGETLYLELAPVDPRSLMQGDYMALRFRLAEELEAARDGARVAARQRRAPLDLDARGVATLAAGAGEAELAFKIRQGRVWLGTNAYFFAEGTAERYERARYGVFRLRRSDGEAVLVGLADEALNAL